VPVGADREGFRLGGFAGLVRFTNNVGKGVDDEAICKEIFRNSSFDSFRVRRLEQGTQCLPTYLATPPTSEKPWKLRPELSVSNESRLYFARKLARAEGGAASSLAFRARARTADASLIWNRGR
jgi:hypothetical protein